jgi:hypothetical protein
MSNLHKTTHSYVDLDKYFNYELGTEEDSNSIYYSLKKRYKAKGWSLNLTFIY